MKVLLATAVAVSLLCTASAQDARFRSSVSTVSIYATVNDSSGRLVTDLGKSDFIVLDNGAPR